MIVCPSHGIAFHRMILYREWYVFRGYSMLVSEFLYHFINTYCASYVVLSWHNEQCYWWLVTCTKMSFLEANCVFALQSWLQEQWYNQASELSDLLWVSNLLPLVFRTPPTPPPPPPPHHHSPLPRKKIPPPPTCGIQKVAVSKTSFFLITLLRILVRA